MCVDVDDTTLTVTYEITVSGWSLRQTQLYVGALGGVPVNGSKNPVPGQFPYKSEPLDGQTKYTTTIDLDDAELFSCYSDGDEANLIIAAHAEVFNEDNGQEETAWSKGPRFVERGNWGTYSELSLSCDCNEEPPVPPVRVCEGNDEGTFAKRGESTCFLHIADVVSNRWGWTNGPYGTGVYTFDLYYGAAQCDLDKGTYVGTVTVSIANDSATITEYNLEDGWRLNEFKFYAGAEVLPRLTAGNFAGEFTAAPGQYTKTCGDAPCEITDLTTEVYVVIKADVCQDE